MEDKSSYELQLSHQKEIYSSLLKDFNLLMEQEEEKPPIVAITSQLNSSSNLSESCTSSGVSTLVKIRRSANGSFILNDSSTDSVRSNVDLNNLTPTFKLPFSSFDGKKTSKVLSRLKTMSADECSSPLSKTAVGRLIRERSGNVTPTFNITPAISSSNSPCPFINSLKGSPAVTPSENSSIIIEQFLRIELGDLFRSDALFANLNLFQIRHARQQREFSNTLNLVNELKVKIDSLLLKNEELSALPAIIEKLNTEARVVIYFLFFVFKFH